MAMPSSASDAESLFRTKKIPDIRAAEAATKLEIEHKKEELRQLVGKSYRDLIDSADTIVLMKTSSESISSNLDSISTSVRSLSASASPASFPGSAPNPARARVYGLASRVKYLVDTPESIWGCLDESMLLEASGRYLRAREVHNLIVGGSDRRDVMRRFPLLRHQWQIVESFKGQISQRSRERLMDQEVSVGAYADALAAAAMIDDLDPKQLLGVFLESRRSWISLKVAGVSISASDPDSVVSALCDVARMIRLSLGQVGELFVQVLNDLPLFYKTVLDSPPGTQLYGGIPNPEEEVTRWKLLREKLESVTVMLEPEYVAQCASSWLKGCCDEIFGVVVGGKHLIDAIGNGEGLGVAEKLVRETLDDRESLDGSLEQWLRSVFGSEIESPWDQIRGLILKDGKDIFESTLEEALVKRMKEIVHLGFQELSKDVNVGESIQAIVADPGGSSDFQAYLRAPSTGGGVWFSEPNHRKAAIGYGLKPSVDENDFRNCLNAYFGPEVGRIRDAVDIRCGMILEDLLSFMESHNSALRLKDLAPYLQEKCYQTISSILQGLKDLLGQLSASLGSSKGEDNPQPPSIIVKRSLFIGRLLFAFRNHSIHIPLILGSPKQWVKDTGTALFGNLQQSMLRHSKMGFDSFGPQSPRRQSLDSPRSPRRQFFDNPRRQTISTAAALFPADDSFKPKFDEHCKNLRELCIKAHSIWISWVSDELSIILSKELQKDDALFATAPLKGWEVTTIKQEDSSEGPLEMKIALPFMPSLYISSFLFQACQEIHRIGGHVLDKLILQNFAWKLFEKMVTIYQSFLSEMDGHVPHVSDKGILQILLDLRFAADILSGGKGSSSPDLDLNLKEDPSRVTMLKSPYRRRQSQLQPDSAVMEHIMGLIRTLSQKLDPIDWAIYESYLWENERQSYKRYAVLFGFLVQLNRMYTDTVQKLPTKSNTESNILRCSTVPRFKYLPISAPALSSRGTHKSSFLISSDASPRSPWNRYSTGEQTLKQDFDEDSGFDLATPLFKSFMTQVGSKFGESTSRLGFMLTDAQVGRFRDKSAAAMSTFGDMLPGPAAGLLSSFTAGVGRPDI